MIGPSEKSGIEIESEYQLTGHPVHGASSNIHLGVPRKFFGSSWGAPGEFLGSSWGVFEEDQGSSWGVPGEFLGIPVEF